MKYFKVNYENGYCGCDETNYFEAESLEDAEEYASEGLNDYADSYAHCAFGWGNTPSEEDEAYYYENCTFGVEEVSEEEYLENV